MRWTPGGRSADLEDRRGQGGGGFGGIGFGGGGMRLGIGGFLVLLVLSFIFKTDLFSLLGGGSPAVGPASQSAPVPTSAEEERMIQFVSFVLDDAQNVWTQEFAEDGERYPRAKLVLFNDSVRSGCGGASAAMGPFYCPADNRVYIDLAFYNDLRSRFGAPGDFAQAYVIAHEIGHHIQNVMGIDDQVRAKQQSDPRIANELSVMMELQADCLAGVWGHSTNQRQILEQGDVEEALNAAAAIGDDRIQRQAGAGVNPETWTHGSSEQRVFWFRRGLESGNPDVCNTFESGV